MPRPCLQEASRRILHGTVFSDRFNASRLGVGNDTLDAGGGHDSLEGGSFRDIRRCGAGTDTLRFLFTKTEWFESADQMERARLGPAAPPIAFQVMCPVLPEPAAIPPPALSP